jgi:hypothetical protein
MASLLGSLAITVTYVVDEDVAWLDITMNDSLAIAMSCFQCSHDRGTYSLEVAVLDFGVLIVRMQVALVFGCYNANALRTHDHGPFQDSWNILEDLVDHFVSDCTLRLSFEVVNSRLLQDLRDHGGILQPVIA